MNVYQVFIATVLSLIMQLAENPPELEDVLRKAIRILALGPGNWITHADATHLDCAFLFHTFSQILHSLL